MMAATFYLFVNGNRLHVDQGDGCVTDAQGAVAHHDTKCACGSVRTFKSKSEGDRFAEALFAAQAQVRRPGQLRLDRSSYVISTDDVAE